MTKMPKAILEIDMPDNCLVCKISDYEQTKFGEDLHCPVLGIEILDYTERHKKCPLIPVKED
jgi:hypothetical protein